MKGFPFVTGLLAALAVLLAALGALCGAAVDAATDQALYAGASRAAVAQEMRLSSEEEITAYIGLSAEEQEQAATRIALYMAYDGDTLLDLPILSERERLHMRDVHGLIGLARRGYQLFIPLAAALAVAIAWTGARLRRRHRAVLLGAACGLGVLIACALGLGLALRAVGFEALFVGMHRVLFTNDLWLLNPETDVLIRMMPQTLFESAGVAALLEAAKLFGVALILLAGVYAVVAGMIGRHISERERV